MKKALAGNITFLFTDIESSTKLWEQFPEAMETALQQHDDLVKKHIAAHSGQVVKLTGDGVHAAFASAHDACTAAISLQCALESTNWSETGPLSVRMGLHSGEAQQRDGDYFGPVLNRAARLMSVGHGGQILISRVTKELVADLLPEEISILEMGEHFLKDLRQPEEIYQIQHPELKTDFPPLKSQIVIKNNLPNEISRFVGREDEIAQVSKKITEIRLLTLTGTGGSGKTRLALEAARSTLDEFSDGTWLMEFAPLSRAKQVSQAAASIFGLKEQQNLSWQEALIEHLRDKQLLLIFDNCEHLIEECALLCSELLSACKGVHILATSRQALGIAGEELHSVSGLEYPDAQEELTLEEAETCEAISLFADRARRALPNFSLSAENVDVISELCRHLDGIPLAIELAAARMTVIPPEQILARLDERFELLTKGARTADARHQTLEAALDWSYELLSDIEQKVFRHLAVFSGGFDIASAEATFDDPSNCRMMDVISDLVDKSLIVLDEDFWGRFTHLETVRQYSLAKLNELDEIDNARNSHMEYFLALAERAEPELAGPEQKTWLDLLDLEYDNFGVALSWTLENQDIRAGLRMAGALFQFWDVRGYWSEGREWLRLLFQHRDSMVNDNVRAKALVAAGLLATRQGDFEKASSFLEGSLETCKSLDDLRGQAFALKHLGANEFVRGHYDAARERYEPSLDILLELDDLNEAVIVRNMLGAISFYSCEYERSISAVSKALAIAREAKIKAEEAKSLQIIGVNFVTLGKYEEAIKNYELALQIHQDLGNDYQIAIIYNNLGAAHELSAYGQRTGLTWDATGDPEVSRIALEYYERAMDIYVQLNNKPSIANSLNNISFAKLGLGDLEGAFEKAVASMDICSELGLERILIRDFSLLARIFFKKRDFTSALANSHKAVKLMQIHEIPEAEEIFFTHFHLLNDFGDPEYAHEVLNRAYRIVMKKANQIQDRSLRASYLNGCRELIRVWEDSN